MPTTEAHIRRVLAHQEIAHLFSCPLPSLFALYQGTKEDPDTTFLALIYSIGRFRFGDKAWSDHQMEYFKQRARENAGNAAPKKLSKSEELRALMADLGL